MQSEKLLSPLVVARHWRYSTEPLYLAKVGQDGQSSDTALEYWVRNQHVYSTKLAPVAQDLLTAPVHFICGLLTSG